MSHIKGKQTFRLNMNINIILQDLKSSHETSSDWFETMKTKMEALMKDKDRTEQTINDFKEKVNKY